MVLYMPTYCLVYGLYIRPRLNNFMALHKYHSLIKSWLYITPIILRIYGVYKVH